MDKQYVRVSLVPRGGGSSTLTVTARVNPACSVSRVRRVFLGKGPFAPQPPAQTPQQALFFYVVDPQTKQPIPVFDGNSVAELASRYGSVDKEGVPGFTLMYQEENAYG